ncbi:hypothetical protein HY491_00350, partial [Candidatus Woesearchaeota archaeon]|nr:hypothetical protein [Candidatus Woesearchaeota archaeon]
MPYALIFDEVMLKQLKKAGKNMHVRNVLKNMLDKIEVNGPGAGNIIDSQLFLYEIK